MLDIGSVYRLAVLGPLEEAAKGGADAADRVLRTNSSYPNAAREALSGAMAAMSDSWDGSVREPPGLQESLALSYAACALADAVSADPVAPWLALAITNTRQRAVTLARESLPWIPPQEDVGRALDELVLEQNRVFVRVIAERRREPSDPMLQDLLTDPDESVAAGAYVRVQRDLERRLGEALSESKPVAERLRKALVEAGYDPRGALGDYLRREQSAAAGGLGSFVPPEAPTGAVGAVPAGGVPQSAESSN